MTVHHITIEGKRYKIEQPSPGKPIIVKTLCNGAHGRMVWRRVVGHDRINEVLRTYLNNGGTNQ